MFYAPQIYAPKSLVSETFILILGFGKKGFWIERLT